MGFDKKIKDLAQLRLPRYTSYPTAPNFSNLAAGSKRSMLEALPHGETLSFYFHIPYCDRLCWFCGCNTNITNDITRVINFTDFLLEEMQRTTDILGSRKITALHFGGGSPSILPVDDFKRIMDHVHANHRIADGAEISIEIDPRTVDADKIKAYSDAGINRASLGVQDFNKKVQKAINRVQSFELVKEVIDTLRENGITEINMDLIYGLPHQSAESTEQTLLNAIALEPARVSLFSYAHVPWMKKHQQLIAEDALPSLDERLRIHDQMTRGFIEAGYVDIGMDHFARPDDNLAIALNDGTLHRNFQGYTTDTSRSLVSFGPSAISKLPTGYIQNEVAIGDYRTALGNDGLPGNKGIYFKENDTLFADVIEQIMCYGAVDLNQIADKHGVEFTLFDDALKKASDLIANDIAHYENGVLKLSPGFKSAVRVLASCFDQYLEGGVGKFSNVA